jgi:hypothetical protein
MPTLSPMRAKDVEVRDVGGRGLVLVVVLGLLVWVPVRRRRGLAPPTIASAPRVLCSRRPCTGAVARAIGMARSDWHARAAVAERC